MPTIRRLEILGAGGMGEVYRAELATRADDGTETIRPVAVKYMRPTEDKRIIDLFEREARVSAALCHPNIVALIDVHRGDGDQLAIIMELIDGVALSRLTNQPVPLPAVVTIAARVLEALAHAHERGIIHRDITPHNVLLSRAGDVKLADFGLAKLLDSTAVTLSGVKGKIGYMAPEQVFEQPVDQRTDLFGLGIMLYQLTTGRLPYGGGVLDTFVSELINGTYLQPSELRPDIQPELEAIIVRLLENERDNRFASAADVQAALAALPAADTAELAQLAQSALDPAAQPKRGPQPAGDRPLTRSAPPLPRRRGPRPSPSRWATAGVSSVAAALVACAATWLLMDHPQRSPQPPPAIVTEQSTTTPPSPLPAPPEPSQPVGLQRMALEAPTKPRPVQTRAQPAKQPPQPDPASNASPWKNGTQVIHGAPLTPPTWEVVEPRPDPKPQSPTHSWKKGTQVIHGAPLTAPSWELVGPQPAL